VENVTRHVEAGMSRFERRCWRQEVAFTVFSISISLVAVFIRSC